MLYIRRYFYFFGKYIENRLLYALNALVQSTFQQLKDPKVLGSLTTLRFLPSMLETK